MKQSIFILSVGLIGWMILVSGRPNETDQFFVVQYTIGNKWNKKLDYESQPYFSSHSRFLSTLRKKKIIVMGMRYADKGVICFKAESLDAAKHLINSDSAVKFNTFKAEVSEADVFYDGCLTYSTDTAEKKATGIGGVFFKAQNVKLLNEWYYKNLGLAPNDYGSLFEFRTGADPNEKGYLQWSPFSEKTKYFEPSQKQFMINYRVENLEKLKQSLEKNGVQILDKIETYDYGKFLHIMDPEGNKIELWEPVDSEFTRLYSGKTTK